MHKIALALLLAITGSGAAGQNPTRSYWNPWNEVRAYAPDLVWQFGALPKPVFDSLPTNAKYKDDDGKIHTYFSWLAAIDLDGDSKNELFLLSHEFFSGGPEFLIMQQRGNRWRVIGQIQGGFTVSKQTTNQFADIETWSRHPETYHHLWKFSGGKYKRAARTEIGPWEERAIGLPYLPKAKFGG